MKKFIIALIVIIIAGVGIYFYSKSTLKAPSNPITTETPVTGTQETASTTPVQDNSPETVVGKSVEGRDITAYNFGTGDTHILFVGGIHGGYEWNTSLVAYQLMDYLKTNPSAVPSNVKVSVIPVLNPDGIFKTTGKEGRFTASDIPSSQTLQVAGRYNANTVDLNRNFDCDWQPTGKWQNKTVSGGTMAFSEPEALAFKNYVETVKPAAVIAWYSAAGGVYASNCHGGVSSETNTLTSKYAAASGYPAHADFDFYELTGDMVNWVAKMNIPGISVLLTNHKDTEWTKNKAGIDAVLNYYAK
jgi:hypothetical protein